MEDLLLILVSEMSEIPENIELVSVHAHQVAIRMSLFMQALINEFVLEVLK